MKNEMNNEYGNGLDVQLLIKLMSDAYGKGLQAGHRSAAMKDNEEFFADAVELFKSGLADSLMATFGQSVH